MTHFPGNTDINRKLDSFEIKIWLESLWKVRRLVRLVKIARKVRTCQEYLEELDNKRIMIELFEVCMDVWE